MLQVEKYGIYRHQVFSQTHQLVLPSRIKMLCTDEKIDTSIPTLTTLIYYIV